MFGLDQHRQTLVVNIYLYQKAGLWFRAEGILMPHLYKALTSPASLPQFQTALTITFIKINIEIRKAKEIEINTLLDFEKTIIEVERHFDNTLKDSELHYYDLNLQINQLRKSRSFSCSFK